MNPLLNFGKNTVSDFIMKIGHGEIQEKEGPQFRQQLNRKGEKMFTIVDSEVCC
jgi:hypothetical protein